MRIEKYFVIKKKDFVYEGKKALYYFKIEKRKEIVINTELIKKSPNCLKYIIIHELIHIVEPSHNANFVELMDKHLPTWRSVKRTLNSQPLAYANWDY